MYSNWISPLKKQLESIEAKFDTLKQLVVEPEAGSKPSVPTPGPSISKPVEESGQLGKKIMLNYKGGVDVPVDVLSGGGTFSWLFK